MLCTTQCTVHTPLFIGVAHGVAQYNAYCITSNPMCVWDTLMLTLAILNLNNQLFSSSWVNVGRHVLYGTITDSSKKTKSLWL